ncbi:MFS transporter [Bacillus coahuilensis m2-6]|uniref:MDR family MFS transporter n=1 Tax=Bacillus coahuilensis TaxID=408580 RepID=UPI00075037E1|nr:MFS transporter [Bacillus coahuilensis]KUP09606.1 MFS transporter [Bacillus coahuilensis m2-6]
MFKELHPNIRIRIYTSFLSRVVGSMIFPFMAIYFTERIHATAAGIMIMVTILVQFIASLYGGYLADIVGRKKMVVLGEVLKSFAFVGVLLSNSPWYESPWITFIMLTIISVAVGLIMPASEAMLIDVSTKETRAFMYSINYWAVNFSMMFGLIIGGWFFTTNFFELLIVLVIMSFLTLWITQRFILETYTPDVSKESTSYGIKPILKSYQTVINDFPFLLFTLGGISILAIEFQRNNYISVRLSEEFTAISFPLLGTIDGVRLISLLTVENTLLIVLLTAVASKWIKGKREEPIMYAGFILFGLGYAYMAFSNNVMGLIVAIFILSIGELLYVPTRQSLLADIVDDSKRGAYMAFNGFVFQIGKLIGAYGIILGESIGGMGMAVFTIGLVLIGIASSSLSLRKRKRVVNIKAVNI